MKIKPFILSILLFWATTLKAQRQNRIGYIDMDYILENVPQYKEANTQLDEKTTKWKDEIESKRQKIKKLQKDLEHERPLLTQELIDERKDEIAYKQKKLTHYKNKRFGPKGDLIKQRRQIAKPVEDEVFNAVQEIGVRREYDFIFDSSSDALMLFSAKRHDISDQVLDRIDRNSNKRKNQKRAANENTKTYKSVEDARLEKERKEKRQTKIKRRKDERRAEQDKRKRRRDSLLKKRKRKREIELKQRAQKRQNARDSIKEVRKRIKEKRAQKRDSIIKARQKARESRLN